jgi:hypothetical protein
MRPRAIVVLGALSLAVAGCGERVTSPAPDAGGDGQADAAPPHDGAPPPHDGAGDRFQVDGPPWDGPAPDVLPPLDAAWDGHVVVPDGGAPTGACTSAGGLLCTPMRWEICPLGTEPVAGADPHLGCGQGGWCCRLAPPSTCSQSGQGNCVPGACTGCWAAVPAFTCETGRVCCQDMCD